jgi:two pore calcium channel protein 1
MMKSYNDSRSASLFFISYLGINLYFLMNLMLAVVYDAFTKIEKDKFRKLFLHKRKAAKQAFNLLGSRERPKEISFPHFEGLLKSFKSITCKKPSMKAVLTLSPLILSSQF